MFHDVQRALDAHHRQSAGQQHKLMRLKDNRDFDEIDAPSPKRERPQYIPASPVRDHILATLAQSAKPLTVAQLAVAAGVRKQAACRVMTEGLERGDVEIAGHRAVKYGPWLAKAYRIKEQQR